MIILKVAKNQGFTLSLEHSFFEKSQGKGRVGGGVLRVQIDPPVVLWLNGQISTKMHVHVTGENQATASLSEICV